MSTKLYTFKVPKQSKFEFADAVRGFVLDNWKPVFTNKASKIKEMDFIQNNKDHFEVDLQFFELTKNASRLKDVYLVRVLEAGYLVHNFLWGLKHPTCNYDDRTDIPKRDRGNKKYAEEIDNLIGQRHYFVIPAVSVEDYLRIIFDTPTETEKVAGRIMRANAELRDAEDDKIFGGNDARPE